MQNRLVSVTGLIDLSPFAKGILKVPTAVVFFVDSEIYRFRVHDEYAMKCEV